VGLPSIPPERLLVEQLDHNLDRRSLDGGMTDHALPRISVIMPVYNGAPYIATAIDSLLRQTSTDWELIVVDDGSTDATPDILARFSDARIRVVRQQNEGEANARNTGLAHMRGVYLAFLDADDEYLPRALEDMANFLDTHRQYDSVFSDGYICDQSDRRLMRLTDVRPGIMTGRILDALVMSSSVITVPVCTMTRTSAVHAHALRFDGSNNLIGTDWDFWIRLAVNAEFGYLDTLTCKYRIHANNITRAYGLEKRKRDYLYIRKKILNSHWFGALSEQTRRLFFLDLLTKAASGDTELQMSVLSDSRFRQLPERVQAQLIRAVGIDILETGNHIALARQCFLEAVTLDPGNKRSRLLLRALRGGPPAVIFFAKTWRWMLAARDRMANPRRSPAMRLQRLMGVR
jgi:glycosyltransferase involved in cell wall biosynthesis